jgi:hypothetical protein
MSEISFDESSSTWLLRMANSSYGIGLAGDRRLPRHLHWGRPLDHKALSEIGAELERSHRGEEDPLEYVAWGGLRYDEPSLKVEYADSTRAAEWKLIATCARLTLPTGGCPSGPAGASLTSTAPGDVRPSLSTKPWLRQNSSRACCYAWRGCLDPDGSALFVLTRGKPFQFPPLLASNSSPRPRQATAAHPISGAMAPKPAGTTRVFRA